ncbi:MAG: J domain-containing protein [Bacteroidetes bacterium]|nr:J domain-containing protein [Bacteroidota bacterium]
MADYYSILGLTKNATDIEIKTAFRKLAKIYHPDKNPNDPNAKNVFELILKAYNTLINPHSRKRYDNLGTSQTTRHVQTKSPKKNGQKEWDTSEEELKRREYYKKHYHQVKNKTANTNVSGTTYSDYKYILFATPIAVGLLMLIISLFNHEPKTENNTMSEKQETTVKPSMAKPVNGDKPYSGYFGGIRTFDSPHSIQINNSSNYDAVIAVFDKNTHVYLQHAYLQASYSIEFAKLPETGVYWKCILGKNWDADKLFFEITLLYVIDPQSDNKQYISNDVDFFKK